MKKQQKAPEIISLSETALEELKSRVTQVTTLVDSDKKIILSILSTYQWLHRKLQSTKFTINKLKKLFGFITERRKKGEKPPPTPSNEEHGTGADLPTEGISTVGELQTKK